MSVVLWTESCGSSPFDLSGYLTISKCSSSTTGGIWCWKPIRRKRFQCLCIQMCVCEYRHNSRFYTIDTSTWIQIDHPVHQWLSTIVQFSKMSKFDSCLRLPAINLSYQCKFVKRCKSVCPLPKNYWEAGLSYYGFGGGFSQNVGAWAWPFPKIRLSSKWTC